MVYEGEQEGPHVVAMNIIGAAIKKVFLQYFKNPSKLRKGKENDPYGVVRAWFAAGNTLDLMLDYSDKKYKEALNAVAGLAKAAEMAEADERDLMVFMELVVQGLTEFEALNKDFIHTKLIFKDFLASNMRGLDDEDEEETNLRDMF